MDTTETVTCAEVARRYPGLCARMWDKSGCTAWGKGRCNTIVTNAGRCVFTWQELAQKNNEWPAKAARG